MKGRRGKRRWGDRGKKGGREEGRGEKKTDKQGPARLLSPKHRVELSHLRRRQRQSPVAEMDLLLCLELTGLTKPPSTPAPEQPEVKLSVYPHKPEP